MTISATKFPKSALLVGLILQGVATMIRAAGSDIEPTRLMCDYRSDPLGIDSLNPRLEWLPTAVDLRSRGLVQTGYEVLVSTTETILKGDRGDLWDSGKVLSDQTNGIYYRGIPLRSDGIAFWKVRLWDKAGTPSKWSEPAMWTMGVLDAADWGAHWITGSEALPIAETGTLLLRRQFVVKPGISRATLNICGLGQYEASINGGPVTADLLTPGWTEYDKTCLYDTYDITARVREGVNGIGVLLGNGMYRVKKARYAKFERAFGPLQVIARIRLEYVDGSIEIIGTDGKWHSHISPMTFSSVYGGEDWDERLVQKNGDQDRFAETKWPAAALSDGPGGTLKGTSHAAPPIRQFEVHPSISHREIRPNVFIYDLGEQASYITRVRVRGPAGAAIRITPSELLEPNGSIFTNNYNGRAWSRYTLSGVGDESYTAKFFYSGHRYLMVEALAAPGGAFPQVISIDGIFVHSAIQQTGEFSCSNATLNRIYAIIRRAELSNMMSVISDCPHRERLGWLEQDHLHGPSFRYGYDMRQLVAKVIGDMADCQLPDGMVPTHVPEYPVFSPEWRDAIEWGSSSVLLPWQQYMWSGDVTELRRNYSLMKRYVGYLTSKAKDGIAANGLGDWSGQRPSPETPLDLIASAFYFEDVSTLAATARILGYTEQAAGAKRLAGDIRKSFNTKFFHQQSKLYGSGSQCANAMALALDLVEPADRASVAANLVSDLQMRGYMVTVGEIGLPYLLRALADTGNSDVIFALAMQSKYPGYAYQLNMGATALCETWNADRDNSQNQFMLGHVVEWFYSRLAGIMTEPDSPGLQHVIIQPEVVGDVSHVEASYDSVRGKIVSDWRRDGRLFSLRVTIPPNMSATVIVPTDDRSSVTEGGKPAGSAPGVSPNTVDATRAAFLIGSGNYFFAAHLP